MLLSESYIPLIPPINFEGSGTWNLSWAKVVQIHICVLRATASCTKALFRAITMPFTVAFLKSNPGCCKNRIRYEKLEFQQMSHTSSWNRSSKMSFLTSISVAASKLSCPLSGNQKKSSKTPADTLNPSRCIQYWCKIGNLHKYGEPCLCFKHFEERDLQLTIFWTKACGKKLSWIRHHQLTERPCTFRFHSLWQLMIHIRGIPFNANAN